MKRIIFYLLVIFTAVANAKNIKENSIIKDNCTRVKKDCVVMPDLSDTFIILTSDTVLTFTQTPISLTRVSIEQKNPIMRFDRI